MRESWLASCFCPVFWALLLIRCCTQVRNGGRNGDPEKSMDFIRKECFMDPRGCYCDNPNGQGKPWINGWHEKPPLVRMELTRCTLKDSDSLTTDKKKDFEDHSKLLSLIKSCGQQKNIHRGIAIHDHLRRKGLLQTDVYLSTALISMYSKCGKITTAQEVFDQISVRNVAAWNSLISGYVEHGFLDVAFTCLKQMEDEGVSPNAITFTCILKACGRLRSARKGEKVHGEIVKQGLLGKDVLIGNALVDMYLKCGMLSRAKRIFDLLPLKNIVSWTILIAGFAQHGFGDEAIRCYDRMQDEGFCPDAVTFGCLLKACCSVTSAEKIEEIHREIEKQDLLERNSILCSALVDMYAKRGELAKARKVFDELPIRNVISWTALISGYVQHGRGSEALVIFRKMQAEGISPNAVTYACVLKACSSTGSADDGQEIHSEIIKQGLLEKDIVLGTALVDMYAKCGVLSKAQEVFDKLPVRDAVCWTALITGYVQQGLGDEALNCYRRMEDEGLSPDAVTFSSILNACGEVGAAGRGEKIHANIVRQGLLKEDITLGNALVDMYAKCGMLQKAQEVFDVLPIQDVVSWNALMTGYAQLGKIKNVLFLCNEMIAEDRMPDLVTFTVLLTACIHAGLVHEGELYFEAMRPVYGLIPTLEHSACLVDLFSSAGLFDKAIAVIEMASSSDRLHLWLALLRACQKCSNVKLGRWVFNQVMDFDKNNCAAIVSMSNIYAAAG